VLTDYIAWNITVCLLHLVQLVIKEQRMVCVGTYNMYEERKQWRGNFCWRTSWETCLSFQRQDIFIFPKMSRLALGPTQPPIQWKPDFFPGDKTVRVWNWPFISIYHSGYEWMELELQFSYMPCWCGQGQLHLLCMSASIPWWQEMYSFL
jgi:hypothetical protein